ncbi:MAG: hypothetical protein OXG13_08410 [Gemmatimonadaceae bacterium]|nr:hypothetical protein [Gemmatimonadaceae bacterium]
MTEVQHIAEVIGRLPELSRERILVAALDSGYYFPRSRPGPPDGPLLLPLQRQDELLGSTEEIYLHEAGHLLEDEYAVTDCWRNAQASDGEFTEYAASDPGSGEEGDPSGLGGEDFAETLVAYVALRLRPERISPADRRVIKETIPARIRCMDSWGFGAERPQ